ncbi:MAG: adenylate/guanylate cyclase domain-containing protein [Fibrobacterota bacterium]
MSKKALIFSAIILLASVLQGKTCNGGILDLRNATLQEKEIPLSGEWCWYPDTLMTWSELPLSDSCRRYESPGRWNNVLLKDSSEYGRYGYATFTITVLLPEEHPQLLALRTKAIHQSYKIFLKDSLIYKNGNVGKSPRTSRQIKSLPMILLFNSAEDTLNFVFQFSNYKDCKGGPWKEFYLGNYETLNRKKSINLARELFFFGAILIISIISFILFIFNRQNRFELYFSLACLVIALRIGLTGNRFIAGFFESPAVLEALFKAEYLTVYLGTLFYALFIRFLYTDIFSPIVYRFLYTAALCFTAITLVTSPVIFTNIIVYYHIIIVFTMLYILWVSFRALRERRQGAPVLLLGNAFIIISALNDILYNNLIINTGEYIPLGVFLMILIQAIMISVIFSGNKRSVEMLTENLKDINKAMNRFIPHEFLNHLNCRNITEIHLGDSSTRNMTVLTADIRSFTSMSEQMGPRENFMFINSYLNTVCPIIEKNRGFITNYIGDAVIALFPHTSRDGINAAREMTAAVQCLKIMRFSHINIGIGLHRGDIMLGTVGNNSRMDTTIISETVKLVMKLEHLTKIYGAEIIISHVMLPENNDTLFRELDTVTFPELNLTTRIYELFISGTSESEQRKIRTAHLFRNGLAAYRSGDFTVGEEYFRETLQANPDDQAAKLYITRCREHQQFGIPLDWRGIHIQH